jgi:hypothetical protein
VSVLGESAADRSPARARRVGALSEDPAAYPPILCSPQS